MQKEKLISWIGAWLIRGLGCTLRIRVIDRAGFLDGTLKCPAIFVFWHNRIMVTPIVYSRHYRKRKGAGAVVLTSPSKDGTLLAEFMARFGIGAIRGSSSRRGAAAMRELNDVLAGGTDVIITPDGPRGPCYKLGPGLVFLAQKNAAPVVPVHIEYARCKRLKSWDRFMIPLPFSLAEVTFGPTQHIAQTDSDEAFEAERARLEKIMQPVTI